MVATASTAPVVPGYEVHERLGVGGFGEVFRARRAVIDRDVAIKVLHAKYSDDPDAVTRFIAEARAVNQIQHPGIVEIFDFGVLADGRHFVVMELLRGRTLRDVMRDRSALPLDEALPILRGIAEAVDAAHAAGVAHRDLKPDNVFVLETGSIKLIDFGLAKLTRENSAPITQTGAVLGTPLYMSPEQCRGNALTPATDVYSFGVLAYHLLVGEPPFSGEALELALHHLNDDPPVPSERRPELDAKIDRLIGALLAKDPALRPTLLVAALDGELPRAPRRRGRWIVGGAALVAAAAVAVTIGGFATGGGDATKPPAAYVERRVPIRFDGFGFVRAFVGDELVYTDNSGAWTLSMKDGSVARVDLGQHTKVMPLPDRRLVTVESSILAVEDPKTGRKDEIATVGPDTILLHPARDGHAIAIAEDWWIAVLDLKTKQKKRIARVTSDFVDARWSPDGSMLLWSDGAGPIEGRLHLTVVADGSTRVFPLPQLAEVGMTGVLVADFVDDQHVAYCAAGEPGTVRVRDIDDPTGAREVTVATLDLSVSLCNIAASRDRIAVMMIRHKPSLGVFDLSATSPQLRLPAGTTKRQYVFAVEADGKNALVEQPGGLFRISTTNSDSESIALCPGTPQDVTRLGKTLYAVERQSTPDKLVVRLKAFPPGCHLAAEWELPAASMIGHLTCGPRTCFLETKKDDMRRIWRLELAHPARELAHTSESGPLSGDIAVSPDEETLVVLFADKEELAVVKPDGTFHRLATGYFSSVVWGNDPSHLLAATQLQPYGYGLVKVGLDGSINPVWTSPTTWVGGLRASYENDRVVATVRAQQQELLLLERTP